MFFDNHSITRNKIFLQILPPYSPCLNINFLNYSLEFVRQNKISITEFAEKICKIPRAHVSLYFNQDIPWHRANSALKAAFINVMFWMDLEPVKRLEKIKPEVDTSSISGQSNNTMTAIEEAENIVKMIQENSDERIDTEVSILAL